MVPARRVFVLLYAASGAAALVYEVTWTRLLTLQLGHTVAAVSTVLAAFMGGLAIGAWLAGRRGTSSLRAYALLEIAIAAAALLLPLGLAASRPLLAWAYADGAAPTAFATVRVALSAMLVGVPAAAMGATFPVAAGWIAAGARYFISLANHHDNFDNYASRYHDWNSTKVGPKRDIVGGWAKAARARGLKFGVSNHSAHAWHWFQTAYGYDPEGARAGERYDAFRLTKYDGRGKWWEGLDPQELYGGAVMPMPGGLGSLKDANAYHAGHDRVWNEDPPLANPAFVRLWYLRCKDLVDSYRPDLLYFDNTGLPLGQAGLDVTAHYYNSSLSWHGSLQVVANGKLLPEDRRAAVVEDVERGFRAEILPHPWQTDTCIGDWHYNRERFLQKSYMPAAAVVHRLCDVVAKNGCLLLSIPVRGDGSIDEEERKIVEGITSWTQRNGEAIFASRPWRLSGEGPTQVEVGHLNEGKAKAFQAADIRFTTKGPTLFAMTLGKPSDMVHIRSLAGTGTVQRVEMVGASGPLPYRQDEKGLHVTIPAGASHDFGVVLRIQGDRLV